MGNPIVAAASLATAPLLPILWLQGRYVRKHTPRLPGAAGPTVGTIPAAGIPLRLLVIGESTVAGVGAPDHTHGLTGQIAGALAARTGRTVHWQALGKIGATARAARTELVAEIPQDPVDLAVPGSGSQRCPPAPHARPLDTRPDPIGCRPSRAGRSCTCRARIGATIGTFSSFPSTVTRCPRIAGSPAGPCGATMCASPAPRRAQPCASRPCWQHVWQRWVPPVHSRLPSMGGTDSRIGTLALEHRVSGRLNIRSAHTR